MTFSSRYIHTNLIAQDWKTLVAFYECVFGCTVVPPERDHHGQWLDHLTGLPHARVRGVHLSLPGWGEHGPTLEIFQYDDQPARLPPAANQPGFAHIAFDVDDFEAARAAVLDAGDSELGSPQSIEISAAGLIKIVYMTDPEGNIIELQAAASE